MRFENEHPNIEDHDSAWLRRVNQLRADLRLAEDQTRSLSLMLWLRIGSDHISDEERDRIVNTAILRELSDR